MKNARRVLACVVVAVLIFSSIGAFAKEEKVFRGYDVSGEAIQAGTYAKIFDVYIDGKPTGKEMRDEYASKVEWRFDFFEKAYPHAGYHRLWLDDTYTSVIKATGTIANWPQEYRDDMWEVKYPYRIIQHLYTNIENKGFVKVFTDDQARYDEIVHNYSGRNAAVTQEYRYFGFGEYRVIGDNNVINANFHMGNVGTWDVDGNFLVTPQNIHALVAGPLSPVALSALNTDGSYAVSDFAIANMIQRYNSEYLTGPDFVNGGTKVISTFDDFVANFPWKLSSFYNQVVRESTQFVTIDWTYPTFELAERYRYYQVLIIDGVVMDGRRLPDGSFLPYIYRYIDSVNWEKNGDDRVFGIATPVIEWKHDGFEAAWPFYGYDRKYVNGIRTDVLRLNGYKYGDYVPNVTWRDEGPQAAYPFAGYDRMYVDGVRTNETRLNGKFGKLIGEITYNPLTGLFEGIVWYEGFNNFVFEFEVYPGEVPTSHNTVIESNDRDWDLLEKIVKKGY